VQILGGLGLAEGPDAAAREALLGLQDAGEPQPGQPALALFLERWAEDVPDYRAQEQIRAVALRLRGGQVSPPIQRSDSVDCFQVHVQMNRPIKLNGNQLRRLHDALVDAFRSRNDLVRLVRFHLNENLETIVGAGPLSQTAFELIEWAQSRGRLGELLRGARAENSGNPLLAAIVAELLGE
jgi:hypothetical protein